ncbi:MAG TPA: hypothetical protein VGM49_02520 [Candidatus Limnocylindrales bacterium]
MTAGADRPADQTEFDFLEPGEIVEAIAEATGARLLVTDRRLAVATDDRVALDIRLAGLRRIQFDIERVRPATLVIVPEHPKDEPQVLGIAPSRYEEVTKALAIIGRRLAETS